MWLEALEGCDWGPPGWPQGRLLAERLEGIVGDWLGLKMGGVGEGREVSDSLENPEYWVFGGVGGGGESCE